jgi:hypothetical protein
MLAFKKYHQVLAQIVKDFTEKINERRHLLLNCVENSSPKIVDQIPFHIKDRVISTRVSLIFFSFITLAVILIIINYLETELSNKNLESIQSLKKNYIAIKNKAKRSKLNCARL